MDFFQTNPVPIPSFGASSKVKATMDTIFDWQYELARKDLMRLYEKGKAASWNANEVDWSIDVDIERLTREREQMGAGQASAPAGRSGWRRRSTAG